MKIRLDDIIEATGGTISAHAADCLCTGVCIDTRTLKDGDVFVAICGAHFDGHDFIDVAVQRGARAIVAMEALPAAGGIAVPVVKVADTVVALAALASWWRAQFTAPCIAITGSNGKSTTKEMVAAVVSSKGPVLKTEGNFNNLIGLPLTVFRWEPRHAVAVLEMGMNAPGEIAALTGIARPDVGVVTNVTAAHLEKLHSVEQVAKAKGELFETMGASSVAVVNDEDPWVRAMGARYPGRTVTFGMQNDSVVQFRHMVSVGLQSSELTFRIGDDERTVHIPVPGTHNVMNALTAFAVGHAVGMDIDTMIANFSGFTPMAMRFECVQLANGVRLVNDSYNANPQSMHAAFRTVGAAKRAGRFIAVLGDMYELGEQAPLLHREVGSDAARAGVACLYVLGDYGNDVAEGAADAGLNSSHVHVVDAMDRLIGLVMEEVKAGDVVLVKGSRAMRMERLVEHMKREFGTG